jgi:photosystem II stability/assembly factor-like uncharacterized protein
MKKHRAPRITLLASIATLSLAGCMQAPDLVAIKAEAAKPVLRTDIFQSAASNGKVLVAGTSSGVLVTSVDGGRTWARQVLAGPASVIALTNCPDGSFVGLDFYRKLWLGDAQGQQWSAKPLDKGLNALAVNCDAAGRLRVVGSNTTLLASSDRGASWKQSKLGGDAILTSVQFVNDRQGFITGEFGIVMTTDNGGQSWTKQAKLPDDFYPYATLFLDDKRGWTSGLGGVIQATVDGGKTWQRQVNRSGAPMYSLLRHGQQLYGVGGNQVSVLRGQAWERLDQSPASPAPLVAGAALETGALVLAGFGGGLHVIPPVGKP